MPNRRNFDLMLKVVCLALFNWGKTMEASLSTRGELVFTRSCFGFLVFGKSFYNLINKIWGFINFLFSSFTYSNSVRSSCLCAHFAGVQIFCWAKGTPPIYTAMIRNTTVLVNTTEAASIQLYKEGNYSCEATNNHGADKKEFSVSLIG